MFRVITKDEVVHEMDGKCNHVYTGDPLYLKCSMKTVDESGNVTYVTLCLFAHSEVARVENIIDD